MPGGGSLRYKQTSAAEDETGSKKRRRLSPVENEPSRASKDRQTGRTRLDTYVFDESLYDDDADVRPGPPRVEDDFNERLFEAMREDEGLDALEGFYSGSSSAPNRWRSEAASSYSNQGPSGIVSTDRLVHTDSGVVLNAVVFDLKDALDEDAYADHIRSGMYRRTHREEIRRREEAERERKAREERAKAERKAAQRAETERLKRAEREARRYEAESLKTRRAQYDAAWSRLITLPPDKPLRSSDFVWPVGIGEPLDAKHISRFLLGHLTAEDDDKARRKALRAPILAYHPDRFMRLVERVPPNEREAVRSSGLKTSQLLNDVLAGL